MTTGIEFTNKTEAKQLISDLHAVDSRLASWAWATICETHCSADDVRAKLRDLVGMTGRK